MSNVSYTPNATCLAPDAETQGGLVWLGFASAIVSAFGSCAALMLIRLSTVKEAHLPFCQRRCVKMASKLFFSSAL